MLNASFPLSWKNDANVQIRATDESRRKVCVQLSVSIPEQVFTNSSYNSRNSHVE